MGFLTPVLIRNDAIDMIKDPKYSKQFCEDLFRSCIERKPSDISIGGFANPVEVMGCKHANEPRLLVVMGNTMVEINPYDDESVSKKSDFMLECAKFARKESSDFIKKMKEWDK
jgi:hypothetical protein